ncbi:MAG TPA: FtsK/SpoIIIE domain-containing protein, partial [Solirubrobacteraceae bacterium]|nr:FtsK/SpoIIIE domain-containing protein [Solirubrobacteraceae bacterium]
MRELGVVSACGSPELVAGLTRWLILQAAILHSPGELVIVAGLPEVDAESWSWLKWLPHLRPDRVGLSGAPVALGKSQTEELLAEARDLARDRAAQARSPRRDGAPPVQLLILLDERTNVDRSLLTAAISDVADRSISVVWMGRNTRGLPGQTATIVELEQERAVLSVTDVASGEETREVSADALDTGVAERAARLLAPVRDVSELARTGEIPSRVGLLEMLGELPPSAESLLAGWSRWRGGLRSTVGVMAGGPFTFDLLVDGPHALIAGTTGSGKSELLRTFVAASAVNVPPNRLSFLLVDYKGGAAFAPCAALPHVVDIVRDLDEHLAERALISLYAELKRRERILAESAVKDLAELIRKDPDNAPPFLVIAVDEFAKLREEVPEFVDGVVDIAQRGRSLGVHMVLAAQTLRNAFTPAIRANTNLRLALRVAEESESEDVIASPLAARIPSGERSRGRAFARTGHGELLELQTAYVSGRTEPAADSQLSIEPYELDTLALVGVPAGGGHDNDTNSDLVALGHAAREAQARAGMKTPPPPWLPVLAETLDIAQLPAAIAPDAVSIGLIDLPEQQRQDPLVLELQRVGNVAVFGAGNSGKTTALTSIGLALARSSPPERMHVYGIDAASGDLGDLEALPHCGGVVRVDDEERVGRLFSSLLKRIERRDSRRGSASAGNDDDSTVVLLLDDL